jgi:hypothetical protein
MGMKLGWGYPIPIHLLQPIEKLYRPLKVSEVFLILRTISGALKYTYRYETRDPIDTHRYLEDIFKEG